MMSMMGKGMQEKMKEYQDALETMSSEATEYTLMLRLPMTAFMTCINAIFAFIVIVAFVVTKNGTRNADILNVMYYIIITPLVTVALTKIAYSGEAEMNLIDALKRVDRIMEIEPLSDNGSGKELPHVGYVLSWCYSIFKITNLQLHYKT